MIYTKKIIVGCHVSIAGGFDKAIEQGMQIGCTAVQIFTKSNRQWASKQINQLDVQKFIAAQKSSNIKIVIAHASYLINLGSDNQEVVKKSINALVDEIKRCNQLGIPYLVLHPGTAPKNSIDTVLIQTGQYINQALQATQNCTTTVAIETMAGQGNSIGSTFEQLKIMIDQINNKQRIGICFDTCHAFAAGYDFTTPQGYKKTFEHFDAIIGLSYLVCFHLNDSKKGLNSHVDRHENIGQGTISLAAFAQIMNDPEFDHIPKILETPQGDGIEQDKRNLQTLLDLVA